MPPSPAVPAFEKSRQSRVTAVCYLLTDVCCRIHGAGMGSISAMMSKMWPYCISCMSALRAGDAATCEHKQQDRRQPHRCRLWYQGKDVSHSGRSQRRGHARCGRAPSSPDIVWKVQAALTRHMHDSVSTVLATHTS